MLTILVEMLLNDVHVDLQKNNNPEQTSKIDKQFTVSTIILFISDLVAATAGTMSTRVPCVITTTLMPMVPTDGLWIPAILCTIHHNHIGHKCMRLVDRKSVV